jgi:hypothetical protein
MALGRDEDVLKQQNKLIVKSSPFTAWLAAKEQKAGSGDGKQGMAETVYLLQMVGEIRNKFKMIMFKTASA